MLLSETEHRMRSPPMPEYQFVDRPDTLADAFADGQCLGVDTEFMREKTYFAQLCLVQLATIDAIYCVDPLSGDAQDNFWRQLLRCHWVLHSARQDIEVIYQMTHAMPARIFDTQIAAGLLGMPPQTGYASLMNALFDVEMAKSHTRSDWTRRPLPEAALHYAAEDVQYLLRARDTLIERLQKHNRLEWAEQDSMLLLDPSLYDISAVQAIDRLKGARNFRGRRRRAAARLAAWRESEAVRSDRPRQWILRDSALLDIARQRPATLQALSDIDSVPAKLVRRVGDRLIREIAESAQDGDDYSPPQPPDEEQKNLLQQMQAAVAARAKDLGIAAEVIASKRELSAVIIAGSRESRVFKGWRSELIGNELLALL